MPTEFQKVMDLTLVNKDSTFVYIDDILIVTKGEKSVHMQKVREVLEVLDKANLQLKADKCKIACTEIEWLGYKLSGEGVTPINGKIQGISERLRPNNLKELRSFLGAVNQLNKFVPDLASICAPFRSILKKEAEWKWTKEHEEAFLKINQEIKSITELTHFKRNKKLRIICDASKQGLGAVLQQQQDNQEWKPVSFASRFLTNFEAKYSINELELLAVVWGIEHFRNYVYGVKFQVILDHKALASVLRPNRRNKTFSSRLTRWVDRLLPFEFEVIHAPGRVLGFADYLSRHPTELKGTVVKAEKLWNDWFTVNTITRINVIPENETTPQDVPRERKLTRAPDSVLRVENEPEDRQATKAKQATREKQREGKQPIKLRENKANENERIISVDDKLANVSKQRESKIVQTGASEIIDKINQAYLPANYEADKVLQKVIQLVKTREGSKISRLPAPWREKFKAFSVDHRNYLYMDQRLVIPANLRSSIMSSIHYGHPGRDTMLRYVADIWWPKIHREVINTAKCCEQCSEAGKNVKTLSKQSQFGEIPKSKEPNEEIALDFAGPFQNAEHGKKYLLVAVDNYSAWPDALFLHKPTTKKVIEFLKTYVAQYGIPKQIRSDPGSVFTSEEFKTFCRQFQIKHVTCPVRDHRGNGKIERLIRTLNERLRTNKNIILKRDKSGLSEILYALRMGKKADGKSPFEKLYGREPNTVKSNIINKIKNVSENDPKVEFTQSDFEEEVDSTILVRERTKGSKLEGQYKRKTGKVIKESAHTITFLPKNSKKEVVYAKRDVAKASETKLAEEQKAGLRSRSESISIHNVLKAEKVQK